MEKHYKQIFIAIIAIKLILAYLFPITSDEAYFYTWSSHLDVNYYDHPPMTGWVVWLFSFLGDHVFFLRLFTILGGALVASGIFFIIKEMSKDQDKAALISLAFLFAPLHMLFFPISTDSPLFVFVFLSGSFFYYGVHRQKSVLVFLSGIFLGFAVLSKYFAGLLLIAFFVCIFMKKNRQPVKNSFFLLLGSVPFVLLHLYWNYMNCWTNIMFNVINRNKNISADFSGMLVFLSIQIYLATPWLLYFLFKNFRHVSTKIKKDNNLFVYFYLVPILILFLVSFHNTGLHWVLAFYPFLFLLLKYLEKEQLKKIVRYSLVFSGIHLALVFIILLLPVETFKNHKYYHDLVLCAHGDEVYEKLTDTFGTDYILATNGYYTSGALSYFSKKRCIVFLDNSKYGRHDDKLTDFKKLDGKDILVFATLELKADFTPFFKSIKKDTLRVRQNDFNILIGKEFNFKAYKELFLKKILEERYDIPDFLPVGDCFFYDLYFPEKNCPN